MVEKSILVERLEDFISKYYKNLLLKGVIYFVSIFLFALIIFSSIEYFGRFNTLTRSVLFWIFVLLNVIVFYRWVAVPLRGLYRLGNSLSHMQAARIIGQHFSSVEDRLINLLQLQELSDEDNSLINASINQKIKQLQPIRFSKAITLSSNKKYLKYALIPIIILCLLFLSGNKEVVIDSSSRIISYKNDFLPKAPFNFVIDNERLQAVKGTDFLLEMHYEGNEIPKNSSIYIDNNQYEMKKIKSGSFSFLFKNPQKSKVFYFEALGFRSEHKSLKVIPKPSVSLFSVTLSYPNYTGLKQKTLNNTGNLSAPEGTNIKWTIAANDSEQLFMHFDKQLKCKKISATKFEYQNRLFNSCTYSIVAQNKHLTSDSIMYDINILKDAFPSIEVQESFDSLNTMQRYFEGFAEDDYGIKSLMFKYRFLNDTSQWKKSQLQSIVKSNRQSFNHHINLQELGLGFGAGIEYYFEVWDNDAINGSKSTKSKSFKFLSSSIKELELLAEKSNNQLKNDIISSKTLAKDVQKNIQELQQHLLKNKDLSWEDKQKTKELLEKHQALEKEIDLVQKKQKENQLKENQYSKPNDALLKKQEELQRLFDSIMNDEIKEMVQELEKMLNDINKQELQKMLENIQQSDEDIEKELDRSLELFKQLELEQKLEKSIDDLSRLSEKQKKLADNNKSIKSDSLKKKQEKLNQEFEDIQKDLDKARELNQKLDNKQELPRTQPQEEKIKEDMRKSSSLLEKKLKSPASKKQMSASEKMKEMSESLQSFVEQSKSESLAEDLQALRQILENLIALSIDQENILKSISKINLNSPIYLDYIQQQNKLQSDAQIIEDSLFSLSKRQPQIKSIVNREINSINSNMEAAIEEMVERRSASAKEKQQFTMTSANNLALILSEALEQIQKEMANMDPKPNSKMCNKPNSSSSQGIKEMKKMQQQIKEQMQNMMKGSRGKKSTSSKGIAQLAAQQEMIRKRMSEIRNELSKNTEEKRNIDALIKEMEENEIDIINNEITKESLLRQETIMTRLLESEKAARERELDSRRESNEWMKNLSNRLVKDFEDYHKEKERQEELLRTIPPSFTPFYKNKVKDYFKESEK